MARLAYAIATYHRLLGDERFRDLAWAEQLQDKMRQQGISGGGRLLTPVLRPHFVSGEQQARLAAVSTRLADLLAKLENLTLQSPRLLNKIRLFPAEKLLAALPCGYSPAAKASRYEAAIHNGSLCVRGFENAAGIGIAFADVLADLFLALPIVRELTKCGFQVSKLGCLQHLIGSVLAAWSDFGGSHCPSIALLEPDYPGFPGQEGEFIVKLFRQAGYAARVVAPDELELKGGHLRVGDFPVDIIFRRIETRELLLRCELSHPLLTAYRSGTVCIVNGFRSELWSRRASLELLTDTALALNLNRSDHRFLAEFVPWTRLIAPCRTTYKETEIDLLPYLRKNRAAFILRPSEATPDEPAFAGAELSASAWDQALGLALRTPYVAQDAASAPRLEDFPVFRYGSLEFTRLAVSVFPHVLNAQLGGASAVLETCPAASARILARAPVLSVQ